MTITNSSDTNRKRPGLDFLPVRYAKLAKSRLNNRFSLSYIQKVKQGVFDNDEILAVLKELSDERESRIIRLKNQKILS